MPDIKPRDFFTNAAARKSGFTDEVWYNAYLQFMEEAHGNPERQLGPSTVRIAYPSGYADVLVRSEPEEPRDTVVLRFTAVYARAGQEVRSVQSFYRDRESLSVLGEAVLPDASWRW